MVDGAASHTYICIYAHTYVRMYINYMYHCIHAHMYTTCINYIRACKTAGGRWDGTYMVQLH